MREEEICCDKCCCLDDDDIGFNKECCMDEDADNNDDYEDACNSAPKRENNYITKEKYEYKEKEMEVDIEKKKEKEIELDNKENVMKMINTQDFIEGYWEENEFTKKVIEKYSKEYNLLKQIKEKNIDDKTALTILIIYFINKEYSEILPDLIMILKKAKNYIVKVTKDEYENLIKLINLQ